MIEPDDDVRDDVPDPVHTGPRDADDDFFCLRYRVWYPSSDCAVRTKFRTSAGCLACDQGRFNLARHAAYVRTIRWPLASGD